MRIIVNTNEEQREKELKINTHIQREEESCISFVFVEEENVLDENKKQEEEEEGAAAAEWNKKKNVERHRAQ